jgi:putative endopeptidase
MKYTKFSFFLSILALILACNPPAKKQVEDTVPAFDLHNLDSTASPCEDFYQYAVGNWMKDNPVPETESRWMSFNILAEENRQKLLTILEGLQNEEGIEAGSNKQMIKDLFASGMDSTDHTEERLAFVKSILSEIEATTSHEELQALFPKFSNSGIGGYFRYGVGIDSKNSEQYILSTGQSGLTLPDRDYYLVDNDKFNQIKEDYVSHIDLMFEMAGYSPQDYGMTVYGVEKQIAEICWPRQELRNRNKTYNKKSIDDWDETLSHIQVRKILDGNDVKADSINVRQPSYFEKLNRLVASIDHSEWVVYMQWKALTSYGPYINTSFDNEDFAFFNKTLRGIKKMKPRNERVLSMVNGGLGEAMGELFVEKHFSEESKQYMANLIENLRSAYKESIENLTWMTDATKEKALKKLASFTYKVGYPDEWKDYSSIKISPDDLLQNVMNIRQFNFQYRIAKLGQPVDKKEWYMTPQMVNAYYSSSGNEIVFPAGILQPPFFHPSFDDRKFSIRLAMYCFDSSEKQIRLEW